MLKYVKCEVCGKSILDESFLTRTIDEPNPGDPVYWANKQFNSELNDHIIFCGPEHSLYWHEQKKLNSTV